MSFCNSDRYEALETDNPDDEEFSDLYFFDNKNESEELWMVWTFYEWSINTMHIYETEQEAEEAFNQTLNESYYKPYPGNREISVSERDEEGNQMYTLYHKHNGLYTLPDKAHRVVLHKFSIFDESISL